MAVTVRDEYWAPQARNISPSQYDSGVIVRLPFPRAESLSLPRGGSPKVTHHLSSKCLCDDDFLGVIHLHLPNLTLGCP